MALGRLATKSFVPAGTCCRVVHVHNSTQIQAYAHTNIFSLREKSLCYIQYESFEEL